MMVDDSKKGRSGKPDLDDLQALKDEIASSLGADEGDQAERDEDPVEVLLGIAREAHFFVGDPGGEASVKFETYVERGGETVHFRETAPVDSPQFREHLTREFQARRGRPPSQAALTSTIGGLVAGAKVKPPERVFTRVGQDSEGNLYLDLGRRDGKAVRITSRDWEVCDDSPINFIRPRNMGELPIPERGGSIGQLKQFLNLPDDDGRAFTLVVGWILTALRFGPHYFCLMVLGEQGSAKSTVCKILRALVDPVKSAPLRNSPADPRDLMAALNAGTHVVAFNNISWVKDWLSDMLCMVASGEGIVARRLYADNEERGCDAPHPILLNGIADFATRSDLLSRSMVFELPPIPRSKRRVEDDLLSLFEYQRPLILGAFLDAMVVGLREMDSTVLDDPPRMADEATWVVACEKSNAWLGHPFLEAYEDARADAANAVFESSPIGSVFEKFARRKIGTSEKGFVRLEPGMLLEQLALDAADEVVRSRSWPRTASRLSATLTRIAPDLRRRGLVVERVKTDGKRYIEWSFTAEETARQEEKAR